jgi:hypothetical protein
MPSSDPASTALPLIAASESGEPTVRERLDALKKAKAAVVRTKDAVLVPAPPSGDPAAASAAIICELGGGDLY